MFNLTSSSSASITVGVLLQEELAFCCFCLSQWTWGIFKSKISRFQMKEAPLRFLSLPGDVSQPVRLFSLAGSNWKTLQQCFHWTCFKKCDPIHSHPACIDWPVLLTEPVKAQSCLAISERGKYGALSTAAHFLRIYSIRLSPLAICQQQYNLLNPDGTPTSPCCCPSFHSYNSHLLLVILKKVKGIRAKDLFLSAYIIDAAQYSLSKLHSYNGKSTFCHQDVSLKPKKVLHLPSSVWNVLN